MLIIYKIIVVFFLIWVYYNLITGKMNKAAAGFAAGSILISLNSIFKLIPDFDLEHLSQFVDFKTIIKSPYRGLKNIFEFIRRGQILFCRYPHIVLNCEYL